MKKSMILKSLFVGLVFSLFVFKPAVAFAQDVIDQGPDQIVVTTDVDSTLNEVWQVMIDFESYRNWNKWYRLEGEAQVGSVVKAYMESGGIHLDLKITKMDENTLCWKDVTWFTNLGLGGWRCRTVWANPDGTGVKFTNHFQFSGPFRAVLKVAAREALLKGMLQENQNLKAFVERR